MWRRFASVAAVVAVVLLMGQSGAEAAVPSGERQTPGGVAEPAYNAENAGEIGYLLTPAKAPMKAAPAAWSPLYAPVYPVGSGVGTLLCQHTPVENCPTHGDGIAAAAAAIMPSVYGDGVLGHDHLVDFPGGADFNVAWIPILVLFTSKTAANEHLLTDQQVEAAVDRGDAIEIPLPQLTFLCAVVAAPVYAHGVPLS